MIAVCFTFYKLAYVITLATLVMQDNMSRNEDVNDYAVIDPLLEKGKQKFNRMVAKQKRREREWAGRSLT